jgi:hypothetical protein
MHAGLGILCSAFLGSLLVIGCSGGDADDGAVASGGTRASGGSAGSAAGQGGSGAGSSAARGGSSGEAAGKGGSGGGMSGVPSADPSTDVKDLSQTQKGELCDWSQGLRGGYGVVADCGNQMMRKTYDSQAQCLAIEFMGDCELSVGEWAACQEALVPSNACNLPPQCERVSEC